MKDEEINKKFEDQDESLKEYVNLKLTAYTAKTNSKLKPFIWMANNPGKAFIILMLMFGLSAFLFHNVDIVKTIKNKFGIELKE